MGKSEVRIEFNRLIVKIDRCLEILQQVVRSRLIIARAQIKNVRVGVSCRLSFNARFFLRRKRRLQRVGDTFSDLGFYSKDVGQLPVITLRPQMRVIVGPDQLLSRNSGEHTPLAVGFGASPKHIFEVERVGADICRSVADLFCAFGDVVSHRLRRSRSTFRIQVERVVLNALLNGGDITGTA